MGLNNCNRDYFKEKENMNRMYKKQDRVRSTKYTSPEALE